MPPRPLPELRTEVVDTIEVAIVELRAIAQPRDIAELRELVMDANDAESQEQLEGILAHANNLIAFCEGRRLSGVVTPRVFR